MSDRHDQLDGSEDRFWDPPATWIRSDELKPWGDNALVLRTAESRTLLVVRALAPDSEPWPRWISYPADPREPPAAA